MGSLLQRELALARKELKNKFTSPAVNVTCLVSSNFYKLPHFLPPLCSSEEEQRSLQKQEADQQQQQQQPLPPPPPEPAPAAPQPAAPSTLESPYNAGHWPHPSQHYPGYHWMPMPDHVQQQQHQGAPAPPNGPTGGYYSYPPPPWGGPPAHVMTPPVHPNPTASHHVLPPPAPQQAAPTTTAGKTQPASTFLLTIFFALSKNNSWPQEQIFAFSNVVFHFWDYF